MIKGYWRGLGWSVGMVCERVEVLVLVDNEGDGGCYWGGSVCGVLV